MKLNFKNKKLIEKVCVIICFLLILSLLIVAYLSFFDKIEGIKYYVPLFGSLLLTYAILNFKNKKMFILCLLCGISLLAMYLCMLLII